MKRMSQYKGYKMGDICRQNFYMHFPEGNKMHFDSNLTAVDSWWSNRKKLALQQMLVNIYVPIWWQWSMCQNVEVKVIFCRSQMMYVAVIFRAIVLRILVKYFHLNCQPIWKSTQCSRYSNGVLFFKIDIVAVQLSILGVVSNSSYSNGIKIHSVNWFMFFAKFKCWATLTFATIVISIKIYEVVALCKQYAAILTAKWFSLTAFCHWLHRKLSMTHFGASDENFVITTRFCHSADPLGMYCYFSHMF